MKATAIHTTGKIWEHMYMDSVSKKILYDYLAYLRDKKLAEKCGMSVQEIRQEPCQHESDGILKDNSGTFDLGCYKCTKCGEYYK